jgi:predicted ferric reductase
MKRRSSQSTFFWLIAILASYVGLWLIASYDSWAYGRLPHKLNGIGTLFGIVGYTLFSVSFFLASRWRKLEDWLGGLDRIYRYHHQIGIWGFTILLIHPVIIAIKWIPQRLDKFLLFLFPIHGRLSVNLGSWAYWLMIVIIGITILKLLRFDRWKIVHKGMSLVFVLASLHILLSERRFSDSILSQALLLFPMGLGFFGIVYKQILAPFEKLPLFEVKSVKPINDNVIEITLTAKEKTLDFVPGQYVFISFEGEQLTQESHPFTLLGFSKEREVSILAKIRGDYTRALYKHIKPGYLARLEGPYGRFDYTKAGNEQVWIGAGIGIVPFLSWARQLQDKPDSKRKIDLFYCVHRKTDAVFLEEFHHLARSLPQFHVHLFCSEEKKRLAAQRVQDVCGLLEKKKILMCGPRRLTKDLNEQFHALGVKREAIFFEDFEFF